MSELVAPDYDGFEDAGAVLLLRGILTSPEDNVENAGTRSAGGVA